jgi:hypothetical protein
MPLPKGIVLEAASRFKDNIIEAFFGPKEDLPGLDWLVICTDVFYAMLVDDDSFSLLPLII